MESVMVFVVGLGIRFLLLILLFAIFAAPIGAAILAVQGVTELRARAKGTVDIGGVFWKPGVSYTAAHSWVKKIWGRTVKVGLDDVARRILTGASRIDLPPVGSYLRRGDLLASVRCGERRVAIPCPVDGVVLARNVALIEQPALFEREPYGAGWMLRLETDGPQEPDTRRGPETKGWLRDENARLSRFLETRFGMAAADGGTLTGTPATLLTSDAWREAVEQFLRAA